jgi:hypothetical protein
MQEVGTIKGSVTAGISSCYVSQNAAAVIVFTYATYKYANGQFFLN